MLLEGVVLSSPAANGLFSETSALTASNRRLFENLIAPKVVKNFSEFYRTQMFITLIKTFRHLSLILRQINPVHAP